MTKTVGQSFPLWVSHTSINDFLSCPRTYYLKHVYRNPQTGNKINLINPSLALGSAVHDVLETLALLKAEERFQESLLSKYAIIWKNFSGELGGFRDQTEEEFYQQRGLSMLKRVIEHPGPLKNKALKLQSPDKFPPRYLLSSEENILLCGKVDWLEYLPEDDSVHIIDFKTGTNKEKTDSLQLPIYAMLVKNCQSRKISKISYWYLETDDNPLELTLPDLEQARDRIVKLALEIKAFRQGKNYLCPKEGCYACLDLERIVNGTAKYIRTSGYQDIYVLN